MADIQRAKNLSYFMKLACYAASRCAADQDVKASAVIIRDNRQLISTGNFDYERPLDPNLREYYECHAELNALLNTNDADVKGCTMYVTNYPCCDCVKLALEAGIAKIIHLEGPKTGADGKILQVHRATENMMMRIPGKSDFCRSFRDELRELSNVPPDTLPPDNIDIQINWTGEQPVYISGENDDHYYMGMAYIAAQHSNDKDTKVGACIVNPEKRIAGLGYNAMPVDGEGAFKWVGGGENWRDPNWINTKYPYVIHAAAMAILNKNASSLRGCTLYTTHYPDNDCANMIIRSGITEVVYWKNEKDSQAEFQAAKRMLRDCDQQSAQLVTVRRLDVRQRVKFELLGDTVDVFSQGLVSTAPIVPQNGHS